MTDVHGVGGGLSRLNFEIATSASLLRHLIIIIMSRALAVKYLKDLGLHDDAKLISKTTTKSNLKSQLQITRMVCKQIVALTKKKKTANKLLKANTAGKKAKALNDKAGVKERAFQAALNSADTDAEFASAENRTRLSKLSKFTAASAAEAFDRTHRVHITTSSTGVTINHTRGLQIILVLAGPSHTHPHSDRVPAATGDGAWGGRGF